MARLLYTLAIHLLTVGIRVAALFHPKAKQWVEGRRSWREQTSPSTVHRLPSTVIWLHAASLGEFEQGRPIIETLRERHPEWRIVLTFFSPSGYEVRKNYTHADLVCYLPPDTPRNAADFLDLVRPDVAIFVKYEFWANYLLELKKRGTPTLLVSALFREKQPFFQWYGGLWRQMLSSFSHFFVQNETSAQLLQRIGFQNTTVAGDTRVDRVLSIAAAAAENTAVADFVGDAPASVLVVGSSWEADETIIQQALQLRGGVTDTRLIIAPHGPSEKNVARICEQFAGAVRYSVVSRQSSVASRQSPVVSQQSTVNSQQSTVVSRQSTVNSQQSTVNSHSALVIDNVGLLNTLYRYGTVAYIGGGFGKGIHNTLEPAAWGLPVIFGPNYEKFEEARQFVARGGGFAVHDAEGLAEALRRLRDPDFHAQASAAVRGYLQESRGATEQVVTFLENRMSAVLFPPN